MSETKLREHLAEADRLISKQRADLADLRQELDTTHETLKAEREQHTYWRGLVVEKAGEQGAELAADIDRLHCEVEDLKGKLADALERADNAELLEEQYLAELEGLRERTGQE